MSLRRATLAAAVGMCLSLGVRTLGTFAPQLFLERPAAVGGAVLLLLGGLGLVVFLVAFYRRGLRREQPTLRQITLVAVLGALVGMLPELQGLMRLLGAAPEAPLLGQPQIAALAPWAFTVTLLLFFFALGRQAKRDGRPTLVRASRAGAVGSAAFLLVSSVAALQFLLAGGAAHSPVVPQLLQLAAIPVIAVGVIATFCFFVSFYREVGPGG